MSSIGSSLSNILIRMGSAESPSRTLLCLEAGSRNSARSCGRGKAGCRRLPIPSAGPVASELKRQLRALAVEPDNRSSAYTREGKSSSCAPQAQRRFHLKIDLQTCLISFASNARASPSIFKGMLAEMSLHGERGSHHHEYWRLRPHLNC